MCTLGFAICIFSPTSIICASVRALQVFAVTTLCKTSLQPTPTCVVVHRSKYLSGIRTKSRPGQPSKSMCCRVVEWFSALKPTSWVFVFPPFVYPTPF